MKNCIQNAYIKVKNGSVSLFRQQKRFSVVYRCLSSKKFGFLRKRKITDNKNFFDVFLSGAD